MSSSAPSVIEREIRCRPPGLTMGRVETELVQALPDAHLRCFFVGYKGPGAWAGWLVTWLLWFASQRYAIAATEDALYIVRLELFRPVVKRVESKHLLASVHARRAGRRVYFSRQMYVNEESVEVALLHAAAARQIFGLIDHAAGRSRATRPAP